MKRSIVPANRGGPKNSDSEYAQNVWTALQSMCIKIIAECSNGAPRHESVTEFAKFINNDLNDKKLTKLELSKLYRIALGTAYGIFRELMKSTDELNHCTIDYALQIINGIFEKLRNEDAKDLCPFLWSINSRCLILGDSKVCNAVELEKAVKFLTCFVRFMLSDSTTRKDLFSKEHQGEIAFMITFFMSKLCSQTVDMPVRLSSGNALLELVKRCDESIKIITPFLPGICCRMAKLACTDLNTSIVKLALKIFGTTVTTCLNDSVMCKPTSELKNSSGHKNQLIIFESEHIPEKNEEGIVDFTEECSKKLKILLTRICSRLVRHQDHRIRLGLLNLLWDIYNQCGIILAVLIENTLLDTVLLLLNDPYDEISALSVKVKECIQQKTPENFANRLRERLYSLSTTIPTEVIARGDVEGCLKQLLGILLAIDSADGGGFFLLGGKLPEQLTFALSSALRLHAKRLRLTREVVEDSSVLGIIDDLPLLYDIEKKTVYQIATLLVKNQFSHMLLDCIGTNIARTKRPEELTGNYLLAVYLLRAAYTDQIKLTETFLDILQLLIEQAVALLERTNIHRPPRDDRIEDDNDEQGAESCLVIVLLAFCAAAFTCTPSVFLCQKLMNETLFELFKWTKSSYVMCAESAEHALKAAASAVGEADTSSLCVTYGKYLLPKVAICSRTYSNHLRTPCVLSSLLDHCDSPGLFAKSRYVVEELLLAIDSGSQEWLILILRAMLSFAYAVGKWFPDVRPLETEFDENDLDKKPPKPDFVEVLNNVLMRTKHLLFSSHAPVRLLVLKIVDACLRDLWYFPDDHLPMIHQNWPAVLDCLLEKNLNIRLAGFQVVITMCELSGSFCYHRFIAQAWPLIRRFILNQSTASVNAKGAYFHSAAFKFQKIVLENMAAIFRHIEARNVDWEVAMEVAQAYSDVLQPEILQNASKNLLYACEMKLKEKESAEK